MNLKVSATGAINMMAKRFMGPFWLRRRWLQKTQWLSKQELRELQLKLLQRLVRHSYRTVPFYRNLMDTRGIRVESIKTLEDIRQFPVVTKKDVLSAGRSMVSTKYLRFLLRTAYTGGTTGTPLILKRNLFSIENEHAFVRRQFDWAGIGLADPCAYLTGRLIVKPDQQNRPFHAYDPFMKELVLSTYHLSPQTAVDYARVMKEYDVKAVSGYPSAVHLLARVCVETGIDVKLRAVLTSSETLTDSVRGTISQAFGCKVFDYYGAAERVCYIFTCEKAKYHIIPEYGLTELIPVDDGDGSECRIVATGFWGSAMPFIRYDTADIVCKSEQSCSCGRVFPVIQSTKGREGDVIKTPSGREFGAAILTHLLYGTDHIVESQIIQDALDHITIEYVPSEGFSTRDFDVFKTLLIKHLPSELGFTVKKVSRVERTQSGKIRPVVSLID